MKLHPVFIKGHVILELSGVKNEYSNQNISAFGISGLPWSPFNQTEQFGKTGKITLLIPFPTPTKIEGHAQILREFTQTSDHMALKFRFTAENAAKLSSLIEAHGAYPTEYIRKYPRIPSQNAIQTFPMHAVSTFSAESKGLPNTQDSPIAFDVQNLSPNGILICTENPIAQHYAPGERIKLTLEPRGWFPVPIKVEGVVCRIFDDLHSQSSNVQRYLGIKFTKVDDINRTAFLSLLREILESIKV